MPLPLVTSRYRHLLSLLTTASVLSAGLICGQAFSQDVVPRVGASAPTAKPVGNPISNLPIPGTLSALDWRDLSQAQRAALQPLANSWSGLSDGQKRKWISLSSNFAKMKPDDQHKLHERMAQWATLTPKQREHARLNFAEAQKIPPKQKNEKWQAYQALSPEVKQTLAKSAQPKPPRTALAPKPAAPDKISRLPAKRIEPVNRPKQPLTLPAKPGSVSATATLPAPSASAPRQ